MKKTRLSNNENGNRHLVTITSDNGELVIFHYSKHDPDGHGWSAQFYKRGLDDEKDLKEGLSILKRQAPQLFSRVRKFLSDLSI